MNNEEFLAIVTKCMQDTDPMLVSIRVQEAWILVSALQLTHRHTGIGEKLKFQIESLARNFQDAIVELHPEAEELLEMGWSEEFDVP